MTPLANTAIVLREVECLSVGYHFDNGLTTPCSLIQWENGQQLGAKAGLAWDNGVYSTSLTTIMNGEYQQAWSNSISVSNSSILTLLLCTTSPQQIIIGSWILLIVTCMECQKITVFFSLMPSMEGLCMLEYLVK